MKFSSVHHISSQAAAASPRATSETNNKTASGRGDKFSQVLSQSLAHDHPDSAQATSGRTGHVPVEQPQTTSSQTPKAGSPSWYSQYGDMTPFVPRQYIDAQYVLPALPIHPQHDRFVSATSHDATAGHSPHELQALNKNYLTALRSIRDQLAANFKSLPLDVQNQAMAARAAWLSSTDSSNLV